MNGFTVLLAILLTTMLVEFSGLSVRAEGDSDYGIEIQNNTVCSYITNPNVNVRSEPNLDASVIEQLNAGDMVRAVNRDGSWVQIAARVYGDDPERPEFVPLQGWVYNEYINGCSEPEFDRWRN